ncbi:MAG: CBS domain-containing protein [Desulfovibrionaceae bacterium]|nr:CBS domain-containing protein [Desulfovibrionaceae bacterium]
MKYVKELMHGNPITLLPGDSMQKARELMAEYSVRHLPVAESDGRFVGLVTHRDILDCSVSRFADIPASEQKSIEKNVPVREIMHVDIITIFQDCTLRKAAETMFRYKIGCLPVLDQDDHITGIITESDFLRLAIMSLSE